jgi:hypothetical protein
MIDSTIQSKRHFSWWAAVFFTLGLGLVVWGMVMPSRHLAILSILPFALSVSLGLIPPRPFAAHFTADSMEVMNPPVTVPYASIVSLRSARGSVTLEKLGKGQFTFNVIHHGGVVTVPAAIDAPSRDVFLFLADKLSPCASRAVPPMLAGYFKRHAETFGEDKLLTYKAREHLGHKFGYRRSPVFWLTIAATGAIWIGIALVAGQGFVTWMGVGIPALLFGFFGWLIALVASAASPANGISKWQESGLVISPVGIALVQGDLRGELRWDELRDVKRKAQSAGGAILTSSSNVVHGIGLEVEAAHFVIADIYDRPLFMIHRQLMKYWRGEKA